MTRKSDKRIFKMSDNSRDHYGCPNKDEIMENIGSWCFSVLMFLILIFICYALLRAA